MRYLQKMKQKLTEWLENRFGNDRYDIPNYLGGQRKHDKRTKNHITE